MHPFTPLPENLAALTVEELAALAAEIHGQLTAVAANPSEYVSDTFTRDDLLAAARDARAGYDQIKAELASREEEPEGDDTEPEPEADTPEAEAELAAELEALATETPEVEAPAVEPVAEETPVEEPAEAIVAAATPPVPALPPTPRRSTSAAPVAAAVPRISLTASSGVFSGFNIGDEIPADGRSIGEMMLARHALFGGPTGERHPIARAQWSQLYPSERKLTGDVIDNMAIIEAVTDQSVIKAEMARRRKSLTASGGWCAPVVPIYDLPGFGSTARPVRDALPSFDASRGGVSVPGVPNLASINDAVGIVTAAEDEQGGTFGAKSCQIPDCPDFTDVRTNAVFHCLQWGNMTARAFPELVNRWNDLTMTAMARLAESYLLTRMNSLSTNVTASGTTLGATSTFLPQVIQASVAMRSRHRLDADTVLRVLVPEWLTALLISDVIKSQFQRFDTDEAKITAMLRQFNVEPTFYKDTASGAAQVFGAQSAGALLSFPSHVRWYLYPEGSFIYLDSGTLEIGLVRDSILNASNDFQTFGEIFENVAFVGVEALAIDSAVCASGTVALPVDNHTNC